MIEIEEVEMRAHERDKLEVSIAQLRENKRSLEEDNKLLSAYNQNFASDMGG